MPGSFQIARHGQALLHTKSVGGSGRALQCYQQLPSCHAETFECPQPESVDRLRIRAFWTLVRPHAGAIVLVEAANAPTGTGKAHQYTERRNEQDNSKTAPTQRSLSPSSSSLCRMARHTCKKTHASPHLCGHHTVHQDTRKVLGVAHGCSHALRGSPNVHLDEFG